MNSGTSTTTPVSSVASFVTLPEAVSPSRAAPFQRQAPLLRQTTGLTHGMEKNPAEREMDRLQFSRREILPSTGLPEADILIARRLGPMVEEHLSRVVVSPRYQRMSDAQRSEELREQLIRLRGRARQQAQQDDRAVFRDLRQRRIPGRERLEIEERRQGVTP